MSTIASGSKIFVCSEINFAECKRNQKSVMNFDCILWLTGKSCWVFVDRLIVYSLL